MNMIQKGFTLIELMIVIAIIGILASLAIPAYNDYTARSQASEAVTLMDALKTPIAEFVADKGTMPSLNTTTGVSAVTQGKYTSTIVLSGAITGPLLVSTLKNTNINADIKNTTIQLKGTKTQGGYQWKCSKGSTGTAITEKFLPTACR